MSGKDRNQLQYFLFSPIGFMYGIVLGLLMGVLLKVLSNISVSLISSIISGAFWGGVLGTMNSLIGYFIIAYWSGNPSGLKTVVSRTAFISTFFVAFLIFYFFTLPNIYYIVGVALISAILAALTSARLASNYQSKIRQ